MNNFKEYGFEAYFEGEILKTLNNSDDKIEVLIGYAICNNQIIATTWDISGYCYFSNKYNLKPIKKEWYENPNNFPCLIRQVNLLDDRVIEEDFLILRNIEDYDKFVGDYRHATKEEVLSLLVKE